MLIGRDSTDADGVERTRRQGRRYTCRATLKDTALVMLACLGLVALLQGFTNDPYQGGGIPLVGTSWRKYEAQRIANNYMKFLIEEGELKKNELRSSHKKKEQVPFIVRDVDDFTVMAAAGFGSRAASSKSYCLPPNCYTFQINDFFGDGISGKYGNGSFAVIVDDEEILSGGNFSFSESVSFGGDSVALSTSPKPDLPPFVDLTLVLLTDDFPTETSVLLEDLSSGEIFWEDEQFTLQATEYTLTQEIDPTSCYSFLITDAAGDGLCCFLVAVLLTC